MARIELKLFNLGHEKDFNKLIYFIELKKHSLSYQCEYTSMHLKDIDDPTLGYIDKYQNFDLEIKRDSFISVEKYWDDKFGYWRLELESSGFPKTILFFFHEEDAAVDEVYKKLKKWVFGY